MYQTQAGEETIRSCAGIFSTVMRDYEFGPRLGEEGGEESSNAARTHLLQYLDGTGAPPAGDGFISRQQAIRTKYGDDFFENCTLSPRNIKQVYPLKNV